MKSGEHKEFMAPSRIQTRFLLAIATATLKRAMEKDLNMV